MRKLCWLVVMLAVAGCNKPSGGGETTGAGTGTAAGAAGAGASASNPQSEDDKTLYALGLSIGRSISVFNLTPAELEFVKAGITAQATGQKPAVELEVYGPRFQQMARDRSMTKAKEEKQKAQAFLEEKAKEPGAQKLASGLIYKELEAGTGGSPKPTDTVKVHYRGTLSNGEEFDSSHKRGEPTQFPLNGVIPCWTEGVQKLKVGGKAQLVCPSEIAYGDNGAPPKIPGGAALVFEVQLIDIVNTAAAPGAPGQPTAPPGGKPAQPAGKQPGK